MKKNLTSKPMKIRPLALGLAMGILCVIYMVFITIYPWFSETVFGTVQGVGLKALMQDIYPYYGGGTWYANYVGIVFGFIDGFVCGMVLGGLYNLIACGGCCCCESECKPVAKPKKSKSKKR